MMRGLTLHSRRLQMFSGRKGGSLATILAKPTGYHSHGVERRSWQWTPSHAPPLILYFRHTAFLLFFQLTMLACFGMLHSVLCLELFLPQSSLPQFTQVTWPNVSSTGRTSLTTPNHPSTHTHTASAFRYNQSLYLYPFHYNMDLSEIVFYFYLYTLYYPSPQLEHELYKLGFLFHSLLYSQCLEKGLRDS